MRFTISFSELSLSKVAEMFFQLASSTEEIQTYGVLL